MQCFLSSRPKQFSTPQQAIEYMVRSGQVRNVESARVSIIGQIQPIVTTQSNTTDSSIIPAVSHLCETVREEDEEEEEEDGEDKPSVHISQSPPPPTTATNVSDNTNKYTWRIDLSKTEQFWQGWFSGLSELFLSCECPK
jgi:protein phosphatase methylesterase 1